MAGPVSLATLRTRIRQRSDNEHTGGDFVTDVEIDGLINTSYSELYGLLTRAGFDVAETTYTITATGATTYSTPADFYAVVGVYRVESGNRLRLVRHDVRHRPNTSVTAPANSYRIVGSAVQFSPIPGTGTYELIYVPIPGTLVSDSDTVDGVLGWEEFLVIDCAIKILQKEESDVRVLLGERERIVQRIQDDAAATEMTESWVVASNRSGGSAEEGDYTDRRGYSGSLDFPVKWWRW